MTTPANLVKPWPPGTSGNPQGRPANRFKRLAREILRQRGRKWSDPLTPEEVASIEAALLTQSTQDMRDIAADPRTPAYFSLLATAALKAAKSGHVELLQTLRQRLYGDAAPLDLPDTAAISDTTPLTLEQAQAIIAQLHGGQP